MIKVVETPSAGVVDGCFSKSVAILQKTVVRWRVQRGTKGTVEKKASPEFTDKLIDLGLKPDRIWWGAMTLFPWKAELLYDEIASNPPKRVLEAGAGTSSALFAALAEKFDFEVVSLENDKGTVGYVNHLLEGTGLGDRLTIQLCQFKRMRYENGERYRWYNAQLDQNKPIDFVMVDGPMGRLVGRNGAIPALRPYLTPDFRMILDDANREHEKGCIAEWQRHYPEINADYWVPGSRGFCRITSTA